MVAKGLKVKCSQDDIVNIFRIRFPLSNSVSQLQSLVRVKLSCQKLRDCFIKQRKTFKSFTTADFGWVEESYPTMEFLFIKVEHEVDNALLGVVYKPPNASLGSELENQICSLFQFFINVIIMGDFNCDLNTHTTSSKYFNFMVHSAGLYLVPHSSSHNLDNSSTRIDAILVNDMDRVVSHDQYAVPFLSSHDLIAIGFELDFRRNESYINNHSYFIRNLKKNPKDEFISHLLSYNWADIYSEPDINRKVFSITSYMTSAFDKFAPLHLPGIKKLEMHLINIIITLKKIIKLKMFGTYERFHLK